MADVLESFECTEELNGVAEAVDGCKSGVRRSEVQNTRRHQCSIVKIV
jgi:hypothetical protein